MKTKLQFFVLRPDGKLERVPVSTLERILGQKARLPAEAGVNLKLAQVRIASDEAGVPVEVVDIIGSFLAIDALGFHSEAAKAETARYAMTRLEAAGKEPVIDIKGARERREFERKHRWEPTPAELSALTEAALGHPKATPNVLTEKVSRERHAAETAPAAKLSWKARTTLDELRSSLHQLGWKIGFLDEDDLDGLEAALLDEARQGPSWVRSHWQALAAQVRYRLAVADIVRTGAGEWYAIVETMRWDERSVGHQVFVDERKCASRDEAVAQAREMLHAAAPTLQPGVSIEARTAPALQWEEEFEGGA